MCGRVATEALGRVDLAPSLVAVAIDEVKYKKGQKYLTVICNHLTAKVIWAAKGRTKDTANSFFDALGEGRSAKLQLVTCDAAEWIRTVVAERAPGVLVCLDNFHLRLGRLRRSTRSAARSGTTSGEQAGQKPPRSSKD